MGSDAEKKLLTNLKNTKNGAKRYRATTFASTKLEEKKLNREQ